MVTGFLVPISKSVRIVDEDYLRKKKYLIIFDCGDIDWNWPNAFSSKYFS